MEEKQEIQSIKELSTALSLCQDKKLIAEFLSALLTANEISEVASRWELVKRLKDGEKQRSISHELGLSLCKITRGSKELKKENSPFLKMIMLDEKKK